MALITKMLLSGSTNGKAIKIAETSTPGATVHTACTGTSDLDEIYLYAYNSHTAAAYVIIEWGDVGSDHTFKLQIPPKCGRFLVCDGRLLQNSLLVKVYSDVSNVIFIDGYVHRIT